MYSNYSSAGAPTGHTSAQLPQEMHSSALITNLSSPSEMQATGQPSAHAPQEMHSSLILNAMIIILRKNIRLWYFHTSIVAYILKKSRAFAKKTEKSYWKQSSSVLISRNILVNGLVMGASAAVFEHLDFFNLEELNRFLVALELYLNLCRERLGFNYGSVSVGSLYE